MTKEEKTELKQLRKRLATIQRGEMREAAQILAAARNPLIIVKAAGRDPGAVAASIGRKKYGKKKFQHAAATGTKMRGMSKARR